MTVSGYEAATMAVDHFATISRGMQHAVDVWYLADIYGSKLSEAGRTVLQIVVPASKQGEITPLVPIIALLTNAPEDFGIGPKPPEGEPKKRFLGVLSAVFAIGVFVALPQAFAAGASSLLGLNLDVRSVRFQLPGNSKPTRLNVARNFRGELEQFVQALTGAVMVNLIGDLWAAAGEGGPHWSAALAIPGAKLHLYGKDRAAPGRKMGHVVFLDDDTDRALASAEVLIGALAPSGPAKQ